MNGREHEEKSKRTRGATTPSTRGRVGAGHGQPPATHGRLAPGTGEPEATVATPRRRRRRPSKILGIWARMGILSLAIAFLLFVACEIVAKAIRPYQQAHALREQLTDIDRQIAQTDADNAAYQRRIDYLQTPAGEMTEARKLGYLRPGEVAVVVEGTPGALKETSADIPQPPAPTLLGRLRHFWQSLTGSPKS